MRKKELIELGKKKEDKIKSRNLLKPEHRKPYQTTKFLYEVIDVAEEQISEQLKELEVLRSENARISKLLKRK